MNSPRAGYAADMTTSPFEPDPKLGEQDIAAADPGQGAPNTAEGFGAGETGPDVIIPEDAGTEEDPR
ncbi:hypothetical protein RAM_40160 [Amycolatopsis mediterranei S699]|nr:hypothetical protein RAM_40160 [Amycolatopsis mediterranei S699]